MNKYIYIYIYIYVQHIMYVSFIRCSSSSVVVVVIRRRSPSSSVVRRRRRRASSSVHAGCMYEKQCQDSTFTFFIRISLFTKSRPGGRSGKRGLFLEGIGTD